MLSMLLLLNSGSHKKSNINPCAHFIIYFDLMSLNAVSDFEGRANGTSGVMFQFMKFIYLNETAGFFWIEVCYTWQIWLAF